MRIQVDQLSKVGDIIFYTPEMQHSCISSKYDKQFNNTSNRPLFESRFLSGDQNESRELSETKKEKVWTLSCILCLPSTENVALGEPCRGSTRNSSRSSTGKQRD